MSLLIALWLIALAAALFYLLGHNHGRKMGQAEHALHVERELGPLLPLLEQLRRDEAEFQRLSAEQLGVLERFRESARLN